MTKTFADSEIFDLLEGAEEIASRPWRHGRTVALVFEHDKAHWLVEVNEHHDEGIQVWGDVTATKVVKKPKTVFVWVSAPDEVQP